MMSTLHYAPGAADDTDAAPNPLTIALTILALGVAFDTTRAIGLWLVWGWYVEPRIGFQIDLAEAAAAIITISIVRKPSRRRGGVKLTWDLVAYQAVTLAVLAIVIGVAWLGTVIR